MNWRQLLYPLSLPYRVITSVRNWAFDNSILSSTDYEVAVISVGNLSTGGTGKTPMVEFLIRHFTNHKIGMVSRGYGRKTKGLIRATPDHSFDEIGDEPYQIFHKFPDITLALSEKRALGIQSLIDTDQPELILLDDAYQHRYVKPGFQILLTTYAKPYFKDSLLPAGNLRETRKGRERADIIMVTKCPDNLTQSQARDLKLKLKAEGDQSVYFAGLEYNSPVNHLEMVISPSVKEVMVVSGIANPLPMLEYLSNRYSVVGHLRFADHHHFTPAEIQDIEQRSVENNLPIITTEKDWVRLKDMLSPKILERTFYLPMQVKVLFGEEVTLLNEVKAFLENFNKE